MLWKELWSTLRKQAACLSTKGHVNSLKSSVVTLESREILLHVQRVLHLLQDVTEVTHLPKLQN